MALCQRSACAHQALPHCQLPCRSTPASQWACGQLKFMVQYSALNRCSTDMHVAFAMHGTQRLLRADSPNAFPQSMCHDLVVIDIFT